MEEEDKRGDRGEGLGGYCKSPDKYSGGLTQGVLMEVKGNG